MFLNAFNHFRAIAIIFVVAGHSYGLAGLGFYAFDTLLERMAGYLITGATSLFVFISGFLFYRVYYPKYRFSAFIRIKLKKIVAPYLILGAIPVAIYTHLQSDQLGGLFLPDGPGLFNEYVVPALKYYWTGSFLTAYWYIPFIFITFLMAPLHRLFIRCPTGLQIGLILALSSVSLLLHRPYENLAVFQSVVYFTPVYLIGIFCAIHSERIYQTGWISEYLLLTSVLAIALLQAYNGNFLDLKSDAFEAVIDLMFIQKLLLCLFLMLFLKHYETLHHPVINVLADTSFAIYFLHPIVLRGLELTLSGPLAQGSWWVYGLSLCALIACCTLIALAVKRLLPRYSRSLIGY